MFDKITDVFDDIGDALVPKEIAPYLGMIAPMVAPHLGIFGSMALSQLGSMKMNAGRLDPYSAVATGIALSTPQARAIRAAGRAGGKGTIGQQLSRGIAGTLGGASTTAGRALDPRFSMAARDVNFGGTNYRTFLESDAAAAADFAADGLFTQVKGQNPLDLEAISDPKQIKAKYGDLYSKEAFDQGVIDSKKLLQQEFDAKYGTFMDDVEFKNSEMYQDLSAAEQAKYESMSLQDQIEFRESYGRGATEATKGTLEDSVFGKAAEMGSQLAEGIFPGFGEYDPVTGAYKGKFDFGKALQTVSVAGTLGSLNQLAEELKKQKELDEQKQREIWGEWFKSYERTARKPYYDPDPNAPQSNYQDPVLLEKFKRFMLATGGRVGYNMGGLSGGIMAASGVPEGMQVDGRNGTFIPMGVKEKADDVPAMLSKNEFVMTADAVKAAGNGDANVGAQRMYDLMHSLEAQV